ncbi:MAG: amidohydrolase family protein [Wenzhouxiangellaceae bacterium]|nr:amidohydrolase family protein [Wenzhouxiangellaceae bacterium]
MHSKLFGLIAALTLSSICTAALATDIQVVHAGELLAVPGEKPLYQRTLVVADGKIREVRRGFTDPAEFGADARLIDLSEQFVMPGLMDMHVHLQFEMGPHNDRDSLKMSDALTAMRSIHYGMKTLQAGFTTVRDVGSRSEQMYALRDAIENGWVDGPRIVAAGGVGITGGHADVSGLKPELLDLATGASICDGPYDCRRATRHAIKYGADLIKIASTGGVMTDNDTGTVQQMSDDELVEVVKAAAVMGRKVAAHAHGTDGINAALRAGVASIEHGTYSDEESIRLFLKNGAYLVPTLLAGKTVRDTALNSDFLPEAVAAKALRVGQHMQENFGRIYKAGVKIAYGTDSGVSVHGTNAQEAVLMRDAGMKEMAILVSATVTAAELLEMSASIGTLEAGKQADLIAMDSSPLEQIEALLDIGFVMKSGKVYKQY